MPPLSRRSIPQEFSSVKRLRSVATAVVALILTASSAFAEDTSAKMMKITDNTNPTKKQIQWQIKDSAIDVADGWAALGGTSVKVYIMSLTTPQLGLFAIGEGYGGSCTADGVDDLKCATLNKKGKVSIKPGQAKVQFKGETLYQLDALATQTPIVMVLEVDTEAQQIRYCAACGDGGSDVVKKDGSDGKQVQAKNCDAVPCPVLGTPVPCKFPIPFLGCVAGPTIDVFSCVWEVVDGTPGPAGTICDGSGEFAAPPGAPGGCCEVSGSCVTGQIDRSTCESSPLSGTYFNAATCDTSGSCSAPPHCPGGLGSPCGSCGSGQCGDNSVCVDPSNAGPSCSTDLNCPEGMLCEPFTGTCFAPCF